MTADLGGQPRNAEGAAQSGRIAVIRQAISCDICGTEKRQTNHWFVAYEQAGELRVSGWSSRYRLKPGAKHLCGQTCMHKLADDFMARSIAVRTQPGASQENEAVKAEPQAPADATPATGASCEEFESSARLIVAADPACPLPVNRTQGSVLAMPERMERREQISAQAESARPGSRNRRADAWERERARESRAAENRPGILARRRSRG